MCNYIYLIEVYGRLPKRLCLKVAAKPAHPADAPYLESKPRKCQTPSKSMKFEEASTNTTGAVDFRCLVVQL